MRWVLLALTDVLMLIGFAGAKGWVHAPCPAQQ